MWNRDLTAPEGGFLTREEILAALDEPIEKMRGYVRRALLLPPDFTRMHSRAGLITAHLYRRLSSFAQVDVMPALGTHVPMSAQECAEMFEGAIGHDKLIRHDWRNDVVKIGEVPAEFVSEASDGLVRREISAEVNRRLLDKGYDIVISVGQVVPHEVVGMANQSKNIFVGCGGSDMINMSHMLGAFYGLERLMGRDHSPVRRVFDYAAEHFLSDVPLCYILTVCTGAGVKGLFMGRERSHFEAAVALSQRENIIFPEKPIKKAVVWLDPGEYRSTWLGNKSVYRTRMAIADGGELIVLAPAVERFGEDEQCDALIRKYGYCGRENILRLCDENEDLRANMSAAAHLIHGSSDGRFSITYCTEKLSRAEIEGVGFKWAPCADMMQKYDPAALKEGFNILPGGEEVYFIANPAVGLWADRKKFEQN